MKKYLYFALTLFVSLLASCSETNDENTEFDNWQQRNEAFFTAIYNQATTAIGNGDTSWKILRGYSKNPTTTKPTDFVVVKVISEGIPTAGQELPLFTDSVSVHYRGYLMPTDSYNTPVSGYPTNAGYQFDSSWSGEYNPATMLPSRQRVSDMIPGYTTALMNMHVGDHWIVYMPTDMGYGTVKKESIPAYSLLMFDMTLEDVWKKRLK